MGISSVTGRQSKSAPVSVQQQQSALRAQQHGEEQAGAPLRADRQELSSASFASAETDWNSFLKEVFSHLENYFDGVSVTVADLKGESLYRAAASGTGVQLILSTEFLHRMVASTEAYSKGKQVLDDVLAVLRAGGQNGFQAGAYVDDSSVTFWSAPPEEREHVPSPWEQASDSEQNLLRMMKDALELGKKKTKFKMKRAPSADIRGEAMMRLARARTVAEVKSAAAGARRSISSLKIALSLGEEKDRPKIRAAIAGLEKVVSRSSRKVRDLTGEALLRTRQEKAEREQHRRRTEQVKYELKRRKTVRQAREHGQVKFAQDEDLHWKYLEAQEQEIAPLETDAGAVSPAEPATATVENPAGAEVCVGPPVAF